MPLLSGVNAFETRTQRMAAFGPSPGSRAVMYSGGEYTAGGRYEAADRRVRAV